MKEEKAKYYVPGANKCHPREPAVGKHYDVPEPAIKRAVIEECAKRAQLQIQDSNPDNITDILYYNKGWNRMAVYNESSFVQFNFRSTFVGAHATDFKHVGENDCIACSFTTAISCASPSERGSGVAIFNRTTVVETEARILDELNMPKHIVPEKPWHPLMDAEPRLLLIS